MIKYALEKLTQRHLSYFQVQLDFVLRYHYFPNFVRFSDKLKSREIEGPFQNNDDGYITLLNVQIESAL